MPIAEIFFWRKTQTTVPLRKREVTASRFYALVCKKRSSEPLFVGANLAGFLGRKDISADSPLYSAHGHYISLLHRECFISELTVSSNTADAGNMYRVCVLVDGKDVKQVLPSGTKFVRRLDTACPATAV